MWDKLPHTYVTSVTLPHTYVTSFTLPHTYVTSVTLPHTYVTLPHTYVTSVSVAVKDERSPRGLNLTSVFSHPPGEIQAYHYFSVSPVATL